MGIKSKIKTKIKMEIKMKIKMKIMRQGVSRTMVRARVPGPGACQEFLLAGTHRRITLRQATK